jgi:hypothetical protein
MPGVTRLARVVRLATLPETRRLIVAAAQSETLRDVAWRAVNDRAALVQDLRNPANPRDFVRSAARHPAVRELASVGLVFLPGRYLPLGWAATWAAHRVLRRYIDPPTELRDASAFRGQPTNVDRHDELIAGRPRPRRSPRGRVPERAAEPVMPNGS